MNIQLPPIEPCIEVWSKFVNWLDAKMSEDSWQPRDLNSLLFELGFRGHKLTHCPFCGKALNMFVPIHQRHEDNND